jgi:hypothetical protein
MNQVSNVEQIKQSGRPGRREKIAGATLVVVSIFFFFIGNISEFYPGGTFLPNGEFIPSGYYAHPYSFMLVIGLITIIAGAVLIARGFSVEKRVTKPEREGEVSAEERAIGAQPVEQTVEVSGQGVVSDASTVADNVEQEQLVPQPVKISLERPVEPRPAEPNSGSPEELQRTEAQGAYSGIEERLTRLKALIDKRLINEQDYEERKKELLRDI